MEDWHAYQKLVLAELQRLSDGQESLREISIDTQKDISALKVKAGIWGAIGGMIGSIIIIVKDLLNR